ncbi:MAG: LLM class flavin-dependent oxidoreductase [Acidimicrobiaceae bacterium]|nr:LLM class flavin-dependent oxidoreductase [Acidimicrobiaceae bacterium]MXY10664.1 LLM class flavin-dependent oxidoreductase [Acidimicrobiaceae bacterium]MXZ66980.1 LLM class flavin-dependent oxidoreductase [Acidimicrobiaceae bacterium]MYF32298.1 LLM class flavin-dependent oxidoreductase [Acidimicrobiaceae bacterium]MYJ84816.1 LLM class flavin-dependent oxidoreductase [Acidimicrobiaceae bacterium]
MRTGVFLFGGVEFPDAGGGPPAPTDRRFNHKEMWAATERIIDMGVVCDHLGFDSYWLTEHHFQYEGYEVIPNGILVGTILAERTENIRIGMAFNIVPQWHPLRLAEDFATMHNISGGRGILGVGRGTVPREAETLGTKIGSFDNPDKAAADELNRKQFDEAMQVIRLALDNETFSFHGDVYDFPPAGIPDRGGFVSELSLVPRPLYPYEIWQAITSPPTLEQVPRWGWGGVFWNNHHSFVKMRWEQFAERFQAHHGRELERGEHRLLVMNVRVEDTYEDAVASVRDGHDEFWKFLGPYGWSKGYMGPDGRPAKPGLIPTLEESLDQKTWVVGSPEQVAEFINSYDERIGLENLLLFPAMPGDPYGKVEEQLHRIAEEVLPLLP